MIAVKVVGNAPAKLCALLTQKIGGVRRVLKIGRRPGGGLGVVREELAVLGVSVLGRSVAKDSVEKVGRGEVGNRDCKMEVDGVS